MADSHVDKRKFFMHAAHETIGVSAGLAALQACDLSEFAMADEPEPAMRVLLVPGAPTCDSEHSGAALEEHLTANYDAQCSRAFGNTKREPSLPENLGHYDCVVLFAREMKIDGESLQRIRRYGRLGGAIVGVGTAADGSQVWAALSRELFGGDCGGRCHNESTEVKIVPAAKDHPILNGVAPFISRGTPCKNLNIAEDTTVLLTGESPGHTQPVAWTRLHHGGRVFYTSLGHPDDFRDPNFLRLLSNAVYWTCGRPL